MTLQMALFPDAPPGCQPSPPPCPATVTISDQPQKCHDCKKQATHLYGSFVFCDGCLNKALRSQHLLARDAVIKTVILACPEGFAKVQRGSIEDFRPLGDHQRVQPCLQCKTLTPVHWLWTGEPCRCPACYPDLGMK